MGCCKVWTLALQMGALVALGAVAGYVDHTRRPVMVNPPEIAPLPATPKAPEKPAASPDAPRPKENDKPIAATPSDAPAQPTREPTEEPAVATEPPEAPAGERIDPELVKQGHITVEQAFALFSAEPPAYFLDARRKDVYEAGHVAGAFRLPLEAFKGQQPAHLDVMPREEVYVVYCEGGNCDESVAVQKQLLLAAYTKVYVMHAGYPGWVKAGHPTEVGEDPIEAANGRP